MVNCGASPPELWWQLMQATPGCIDPDPSVPPVQLFPLVHVGATEKGSGGGVPARTAGTLHPRRPAAPRAAGAPRPAAPRRAGASRPAAPAGAGASRPAVPALDLSVAKLCAAAKQEDGREDDRDLANESSKTS